MTTGIRVVSEETINREYLFIGTAIVTSADKRERYNKHRLVFQKRHEFEEKLINARLFLSMGSVVVFALSVIYVFHPLPSCLFWIGFFIYHSVLIWLLWKTYITYYLNRNEFFLPNDPFASSVTNKRMVLSFVLGLFSPIIWGIVYYLAKVERAYSSAKPPKWILRTLLFLGPFYLCSQLFCLTSCMPFGFEPLPVYSKNCPPKYTLTPSN